MSKFKVGEIVRVRKDISEESRYSARMLFTQEMYQHVSKTFKVITIDSFRNDTQYKLEGLDFWWHEDWLESAYEKIEVEQQMADWLDTMPDAWKLDADLALYKVVAASSAYQRDELRSKKLVPIWLIESVIEPRVQHLRRLPMPFDTAMK
ncbi:hypothetical protein MFLO_14777, partial [Listeria floridensis FSL S10-1187]